jgi:isopenicillin-N epimerase
MIKNLHNQFLLDPDVIFLNHGSFGATPRPVFDVYQEWQRQLEKQPIQFLIRDSLDHFRIARQGLASYLGADPLNLVFIPNATFGVNIVGRSLDFQPGDQVLTTNHEYGACENVWDYLSQKNGIKVIKIKIPLPLPKPEEIVELFWAGVTEKTKLIFISQITSSTAVRFPTEEICQKAHDAGILTLIDGAHAPGQIPLNLAETGADFYTGNCHKWMMAPKGSAFLHVVPEHQELIEPLVVSWGWGENCPYQSDSRFLDLLEWWGTTDPAAYFSVPAAIRFMEINNWELIRNKCQSLLRDFLERINTVTGFPSIYGENDGNFIQIAGAELPKDNNPGELQAWLYDQYRIEVPVIQWDDRWLIRPSVQGYNTRKDLDKLIEAIDIYLKR